MPRKFQGICGANSSQVQSGIPDPGILAALQKHTFAAHCHESMRVSASYKSYGSQLEPKYHNMESTHSKWQFMSHMLYELQYTACLHVHHGVCLAKQL